MASPAGAAPTSHLGPLRIGGVGERGIAVRGAQQSPLRMLAMGAAVAELCVSSNGRLDVARAEWLRGGCWLLLVACTWNARHAYVCATSYAATSAGQSLF